MFKRNHIDFISKHFFNLLYVPQFNSVLSVITLGVASGVAELRGCSQTDVMITHALSNSVSW